jgi:hypothetical protein
MGKQQAVADTDHAIISTQCALGLCVLCVRHAYKSVSLLTSLQALQDTLLLWSVYTYAVVTRFSTWSVLLSVAFINAAELAMHCTL